MVVGTISPRQKLPSASPVMQATSPTSLTSASPNSPQVASAKPTEAHFSAGNTPNRNDTQLAACVAPIKAMALTAKASENWVADSPKPC